MAREVLTEDEIRHKLGALHPSWTGDKSGLKRTIEFRDFPTAVQFIQQLAPVAEDLDHHPDVDLRWRKVVLSLSTHSAGGVTDADIRLAGLLDEIAESLPLAG